MAVICKMLETSKSFHFVHRKFGEKSTMKISTNLHHPQLDQTGSEESREETGAAHQTEEASGAL